MEQQIPKTSASDPSRSLSGLAEAGAAAEPVSGLPPVHLWDPPLCGGEDFLIRRDGSWHYRGSEIHRRELVRLFSTIMRKDEDGCYYLVTPVEKCLCVVEDAPFLAIDLRVEGSGKEQVVHIITNVGDRVPIGPENPLRFEIETGTAGLKPYVRIRAALEALVSRALLFDLVELSQVARLDGEDVMGLWSGGTFWRLEPGSSGDAP